MAIVRGKGLPLGGKPVSLTPPSDGDALVFNQALGEFTPQPVLVTNPDAPPPPSCIRVVVGPLGVLQAVWEKPRLYAASGPYGASMWSVTTGTLTAGLVNNGAWDVAAWAFTGYGHLTLDLGVGQSVKFGRAMVVHDIPPVLPDPSFPSWGKAYSSAGVGPDIELSFSDNGTTFHIARYGGGPSGSGWKDVVADLGGGKYASFIELPAETTAHRYWRISATVLGNTVYEVQWATSTDADDGGLSYEVHAGAEEAAQLVAVIPAPQMPTTAAPWDIPDVLQQNTYDLPPWEDRWSTGCLAVCTRSRASGKASAEPFPWAWAGSFTAAEMAAPSLGILPKWDPTTKYVPSKIEDDGTTPRYDGNPMFHDGTKEISVAADAGATDTGAAQPVVHVSIDGAAAIAKLGTANGDLVILHGADRIASFGPGNGGSMYGAPIFPKQVRLFGHVYHEVDLTTFTPSLPHTPQEAVRIIAKAHKSDGSQSAAVNITNNPDGSDIVQPGVYHAIQINVSADAPSVAAELGGVVCFLKQVGATTTSIVPFDASAQVANGADGPTANMVGLNVGLKNDYLGVTNTTEGAAVFARQAGVGTSGKHGSSTGKLWVIRVDRPQWWDYVTGTITAPAGSTITGSGTAWTNVLKVGEEGACSLLGKWITWTAASGTVVSKRISSVTNNTTLQLTEAIVAGETAAAGTAYRIISSDPWDAVVGASGLAASPAIDLTPEDRLAPSRFGGVMAVQTASPTTPATKYGWTWDGIGKLKGLRTDQAAVGPPFVTARAKGSFLALATTTLTDIPSATVTITPPVDCRVAVHIAVDAGYVSGSSILIVKLVVNGTVQDVETILCMTLAGGRACVSNNTTVELTAGTAYTIKLQAQMSGAGSYNLFGSNTGLTVIGVGKL